MRLSADGGLELLNQVLRTLCLVVFHGLPMIADARVYIGLVNMPIDCTLCHLQSPIVTTQSSSRGEQLAKRLKEAGAKMYGAFWCSHCHEQKEAFGSQAMKDFPYVECYPDGFHKVSHHGGHQLQQLPVPLLFTNNTTQTHIGLPLY